MVIINETNDRLETDQPFWDQEKDLIYTDRLVKITNEDQTVIGMDLNPTRGSKTKNKNVSATIYLKEE